MGPRLKQLSVPRLPEDISTLPKVDGICAVVLNTISPRTGFATDRISLGQTSSDKCGDELPGLSFQEQPDPSQPAAGTFFAGWM
jgi:hypothetical protein